MDFPAPFIQPPQDSHTHTVILLHGRGSDGVEFAQDFFSSQTSKNQDLASCLPSWRWVFPTSRFRWSTTFQEEECSWFDAYSLTNIHERQELQIGGLRESVSYILDILDAEIDLLNGRSSCIYLGGISQGMATALWTLFCATRRVHGQLGGFVGFCGWMPFAMQIEELKETTGQNRPVLDFCHEMILGHEPSVTNEVNDMTILRTPVFLSHGTDDPWVSVDLGRQASRVVRQIMGHVEWSEFARADNDGHWIKEPEGFDHILGFLEKCDQRNGG